MVEIMASLKNHKKKEILFEMDDIKLMNPNIKQENELREKLEQVGNILDDEVTFEAGIDIIRYILLELTNIDNDEINSMTDEELDLAFDGDEVLVALSEAIEGLIKTIVTKMATEYKRQFKMFTMILEANKNEEKVNKIIEAIRDFENSTENK